MDGPEDADRTGERLLHFRLDARIGQGGMGVVYRAYDEKLRRRVAVKLLSRTRLGPQDVDALLREARHAAAVVHPSIASVHDVCEDGDLAFLVMEFVDGEPLRARIARAPMAPAEVGDVALAIAEGLAAAHRARVVHRDLKPENVLVCDGGRVKILDFGAARPADEAARGEPVDAREDVFAFGVLLFEMIAARRPFEPNGGGGTPAAMDEATRSLAGRAPPALLDVMARCLRMSPEDRYADGAAIVEALKAAPGKAGPRRPRPTLLAFGVATLALAGALATLLISRAERGARGASPGGCATGPGVRFADGRAVAACAGAWTGDVSNARALCAPGWRVCRGLEPGIHTLSLAQASSIPGCFALDAAQDDFACYPGCAAAVARGIDTPDLIDMGGVGADCPFRFESGESCIAGGRIDASENSGTGCRFNPRLTGAMCCPAN